MQREKLCFDQMTSDTRQFVELMEILSFGLMDLRSAMHKGQLVGLCGCLCQWQGCICDVTINAARYIKLLEHAPKQTVCQSCLIRCCLIGSLTKLEWWLRGLDILKKTKTEHYLWWLCVDFSLCVMKLRRNMLPSSTTIKNEILHTCVCNLFPNNQLQGVFFKT